MSIDQIISFLQWFNYTWGGTIPVGAFIVISMALYIWRGDRTRTLADRTWDMFKFTVLCLFWLMFLGTLINAIREPQSDLVHYIQ